MFIGAQVWVVTMHAPLKTFYHGPEYTVRLEFDDADHLGVPPRICFAHKISHTHVDHNSHVLDTNQVCDSEETN